MGHARQTASSAIIAAVLLVLAACDSGSDAPASGAPVTPVGPPCGVTCPSGTRPTKAPARELRDQGTVVIGEYECTLVCVPDQPCRPPSAPRVTVEKRSATYECVASTSTPGIPNESTLDIDYWKPTPEGTLRKRATLQLGAVVNTFRIADFDGDGVGELAGVFFDFGDLNELRAYRLVGISLVLGSTTPLPPMPNPVIDPAGDFDGDGRADLFVRPVGPGTGPTPLYLASSIGAGFSVSTSDTQECFVGSGFAYPEWETATADFDGDGKDDFVAVTVPCGTPTGAPSVSIRSGGIGPSLSLGVASCVVLGDLNSDGRPDIVVRKPSGGYASYLNQGGGVFTELSPSGAALPSFVGVGDFSGDGVPDLLTIDSAKSGQLFKMTGDGKGAFSAAAPVAELGEYARVGLGDVDGDGELDVASIFGKVLTVRLGRGGPSVVRVFDKYVWFAGDPIGDLDGDGRDEIVVMDGVALQVLSLK